MSRKIKSTFIWVTISAILLMMLSASFISYTVIKSQVFDDLKEYTHLASLTDFQNDPTLDTQEMRITLIEPDGTVAYDSQHNIADLENHSTRPEIIDTLATGEGQSLRFSTTLGVGAYYYALKLEDGSILRVSKNSAIVRNLIIYLCLGCLLIVATIVILILILSPYLTKKIVNPIKNLDLDQALLDDTLVYDELKPFVHKIREQHDRLLKNSRMRQEFTANVSHELKTPLTAISGYAQLIASGITPPEDTLRFSQDIDQNATRLLGLINDILELSKLDASDFHQDSEKIDLYVLAKNTFKNMSLLAQKKDLILTLNGYSSTVRANRHLMEELVNNLCDNAIRYNRTGGKVTITVDSIQGHVCFKVEDTGIGISTKNQKRVFERFYRVDKSRSRENGGTGLGLAIVKHIVEQYDGILELTSEPGVGTTVKITF